MKINHEKESWILKIKEKQVSNKRQQISLVCCRYVIRILAYGFSHLEEHSNGKIEIDKFRGGMII